MARSISRYIDFGDLANRGPSATIVIKLMMVCNDMTLANQALGEWKQPQEGNRKLRQAGARIYFHRLQMAHLYEGFEVIGAIKADAALVALIEQCDERTRESFHVLADHTKGGASRKKLEKLLGLPEAISLFITTKPESASRRRFPNSPGDRTISGVSRAQALLTTGTFKRPIE